VAEIRIKKIGFVYKNQIDPFDGGPHLWANVDDILPVKKIATYAFVSDAAAFKGKADDPGLLCKVTQRPGEFRAVAIQALIDGGKLSIDGPRAREAIETLGLTEGESVVFMPYY